ncbi:MAG: ribonuclease E/G [Candidatus Thorarchaeota archaeon]
MTRIRLRGIYSEALTQIALQNHYEIVHPSPETAGKLGLPQKRDIPDIDVWDRSDMQGVVAIGYEHMLSQFIDILRRRLNGVITRVPRVAKSSIYKGLVLGQDEKTGQTRVDLGTITGLLPERGFTRGSYLMVQVRAHDYGRKSPVLSSSITIPGRAAVLLPESAVRVSNRIQSPERRKVLLALGEMLRQHTDDWGILWRTAAEELDEMELRNEVDDLLDAAQQINHRFHELDRPGLLFEGPSNADIEFPLEVKETLDKIRSQIHTTIPHHHFYKCAGYFHLVDFAESLLEERPAESSHVISRVERFVGQRMPKVDDPVSLEHVKLDGRTIVLSHARVIEASSDRFKARRQFSYTSRKLKIEDDYPDVVDVQRDEGDYAIIKVVPGASTLVTDYYSSSDELKGTYVNVNTGVEVYPGMETTPSRVRYVDLEIDVIKLPDRGKVRIIDQHLLKRAVQRGFITDKVAEGAMRIAETLYHQLSEV